MITKGAEMKKRYLCLAIVSLLTLIPIAVADPMQELIETLGSEYEALIPPPSGSIGTDYPSRQAALGSLYTTRSIGLIYYQNKQMLARQEALLNRYDQVIQQNRQIINLLRTISERITPTEQLEPHASSIDGYTE